MSVKSEILANLEKKLKELGIFKKVKRGLKALADVRRDDFPLCVYNSFKTEKVDALSSFNVTTRRLYIDVFIYDKTSANYFDRIDEYEEAVLSMLECISPSSVHDRCLNVSYVISQEPVNDEYIDNLFILRIIVIIDYRA
jgi:hypothetical protein